MAAPEIGTEAKKTRSQENVQENVQENFKENFQEDFKVIMPPNLISAIVREAARVFNHL